MEGTRAVYCNDSATEALTNHGWKHWWEIEDDDEFLTVNPETQAIVWQSHSAVNLFNWDGPLTRWKNKTMDALTTPSHRWLIKDWRERDSRYRHRVGPWQFRTTKQLSTGRGRTEVVAGGGTPFEFPDTSVYSDAFVELIGWVISEGHYQVSDRSPNQQGIIITQSKVANPEKVERIRALLKTFTDCTVSEYCYEPLTGKVDFYIGKGLASTVRAVAPNKQLTPDFLCSITEHQARLLFGSLMAGGGHVRDDGPTISGVERRNTRTFTQKDQGRIDGFQMLCAMLGIRTHARLLPFDPVWKTGVSNHTEDPLVSEVTAYHRDVFRVSAANPTEEHYKGVVWCPTTPNGTWLARRNGVTYWTGNSLTELWTESDYQVFINDELIESNENPLGVIPFVHIANTKVTSTPWGLSDLQDITDLNRQYNEVATLAADIADYFGSPQTIIFGAKSNNLERGPKKVWAIPNDKARVENLALNGELDQVLNFLQVIKEKIHELAMIPVNAFGMPQQISNTSGVALSLQFLPLMQTTRQKQTQYASGFQRLNELIIRTAALYMPEMLILDPSRDAPLEEGQLSELDPRDPLTYRNEVRFASPLPLDKLVALNEIQMKMGLGLESKKGALEVLGEQYPAEKLQELMEELHQDSLEQGALDLLNSYIQLFVATMTGQGVDPQTGEVTTPGQQNGPPNSNGKQVPTAGSVNPPGPAFANNPEVQSVYQQMNQLVAGTKIPQVRNPLKGETE